MNDPWSAEEALSLLSWKRAIFDLYRSVRADEPEAGWRRWRSVRDELFRSHPQSPIAADRRDSFEGLEYFDYRPSARVVGELRDAQGEPFEISTSGTETMWFSRFATCTFSLEDHRAELDVYWLEAYGGGIFLPFRDETSGSETYGAGRYLLDTVKGADLGSVEGALILDFNFAYNPSCAYDPRWVCPLAPRANRLDVAVRAGERTPR